jgi:hypothetical protein
MLLTGGNGNDASLEAYRIYKGTKSDPVNSVINIMELDVRSPVKANLPK